MFFPHIIASYLFCEWCLQIEISYLVLSNGPAVDFIKIFFQIFKNEIYSHSVAMGLFESHGPGLFGK